MMIETYIIRKQIIMGILYNNHFILKLLSEKKKGNVETDTFYMWQSWGKQVGCQRTMVAFPEASEQKVDMPNQTGADDI